MVIATILEASQAPFTTGSHKDTWAADIEVSHFAVIVEKAQTFLKIQVGYA